MKREVKRMVREERKRVNEEWTLSIPEKIWKGVNEVKKVKSM